jgi:SAM-dependent methyltransferase
MNCRHCGRRLELPFVDLGCAPPSNAYVPPDKVQLPEKRYPLRVLVCESCWLVQTQDYVRPDELFDDDYPYFSSVSSTAVEHARRYVEGIIGRLTLDSRSLVAEVAANDGYLLQFVQQHGIPCYGIEPTRSTASAARSKGLLVVEAFLGRGLADQLIAAGRQADLLVANNVLAHVADINDFVASVAMLLKPKGVATFEFPYLPDLVRGNQFDTIYHEHYSYLSLTAAQSIFDANGLRIIDVEKLPTHGGSVRVFAQRASAGTMLASQTVVDMLDHERSLGVNSPSFYEGFQARAEAIRDSLLAFLQNQKGHRIKVGGYGAAAKGNTLLNFAGVGSDLLPYVVDRSPGKHGRFLPGSKIPVVDEQHLREDKPDWILILPWNLREEIISQLAFVREWGGRFVQAVPELICSD